MNISVHNNLLMINAGNQYKINFGKETKAAEKLSSGYRINKASDDAAGLQISEKMRAQIRGLRQGSENAGNGISWLQTGDGALGEVQAMLHRMKELTVKSLNDTNTQEDRVAIQAEFDALQSEIDHIFDTTEFNNKRIFADHEPTYYQFEGNVVWQQSQTHVISGGANDLIIECVKDGTGNSETIRVAVSPGVYTTQELIDELEDAMSKSGAREKGLVMEYTQDGTCNLNFEGGERIERVGGELAYLLYDVYEGGSMGALIGTTVFPSEYSKLRISSENNQLSFDIESFGGTSKKIDMMLPDGAYTKQQLIDLLNEKLDGTSVKAIEYGTGIKLTSNDSIITRFKGNMFKIDEGTKVYTSVFYDNVKYGNVTMGAASFLGGGVIPTESRDEEHRKYEINGNNNQLQFQANGSSTQTTISIPEGTYTVDEMVSKLNQLFAEKKLELNASIRSTGGYQGIRIDSTVKGVVSKVGIDKNSSAFDTLFVNRTYNAYTADASYSRESTADKGAVFKGAKPFLTDTLPLEITGANNTFRLSLTTSSGTSSHTITLATGRYTTAQDIATAINDQLSDAAAPAAYRGLVKATVEDNKIILTGEAGVTSVSALANSSSTGYKDIFVWDRITYVKQDVSGSTVTTNTAIPDGTTIAPGDNTLQVELSGNTYNITLPTGNNVTHKDITDAIENAVKEKTVTGPNTFSNVSARGSSTDANFVRSGYGDTVVKSGSYTGVGSSQENEGIVGDFIYNNPAKVTITPALSETTVVTKENNQLQLQINGDIKNLIIPDGTYNRQGLAKIIQNQIDAVFGKYMGGAVVSVNSSGQLELEARLNGVNGVKEDGAETRISCSTGESSFLRELNTTRTSAQITSSEPLKSSITIADDCNSLSFSYVENGTSKTADIVLRNGTYSRTGIRDEINRQLQAAGIGVTAGLNGNNLVLETNVKGKGNSITFNSRTAGSAVEALFGDLTTERSAKAGISLDMQEKIQIDGASNTFKMTVNGSPCNLTLDSGEYSRSEFVDMLNRKFTDANAGITASLEGKRIVFETDKKGSGASFSISYSSGGTSMKAIYGETTTVTPGLKASFTTDGKLSLTSTTGQGNIKISSNSGSVFQEPLAVPKTENPSASGGYYSTKNCYIDGVNISESVSINEWNNDLQFDYYADEKRREVSISIPEKEDYTFAELQSVLQDLLDAKLGQDQLKATVSSSGVRIETEKTGSKYYMANFKGDFYDKVLCSTRERSEAQTAQESNGSQTNDLAYTVGRQDVRNEITELKAGFSDTLSLDFTYGGTTRTLNMKLTPGEYDGNSLAGEIQEQLNKALVDAGFEEDTIEVGIGGVNTGVVGSNDSNALVFKLSSAVRLPGNGQYIIDGVGGNAAFSVFYQTDGKMEPAYIKGCKDISEGVKIEAGKEQFSFEIDGTEYSITVPEGDYTNEEIIETINNQLQKASAPVTAESEDGRLLLHHNALGSYKIGNVKGAAKQALFFQENGAMDGAGDLMLQLSGKLPDYTVIERQAVNTVFLGINSIVVTAPKYAEKALGRLDGALNKVSEIRSDFGSKQNQLEYTIKNNENEEENTQSAESMLRDTDMAQEIVHYSKANILKEAAQSMMAQSDVVSEGVLKLLT